MGKLGDTIRDRRKELAIKVYELAKTIEVHPTYITYIEKHGRLPSLEIISKLEEVLRCNLKEHYFNEKHPEVRLNLNFKIKPEIVEQVNRIKALQTIFIKSLPKEIKVLQDPKIQKELKKAVAKAAKTLTERPDSLGK